jgi:Flp pilus assembly pilin Flp
MFARLRRAARGRRGASTVEFGLLLAAIAAVAILVAAAFTSYLHGGFRSSCQPSGGTVSQASTTTCASSQTP